jgi:hypothetical protein
LQARCWPAIWWAGFKGEGCPLHLVFQLCSNKTRSRSQRLGVRRGRMAQTNVDQAIARRVRPEVITECHSSWVCNIYFGGWHLRGCKSAGMWKGCLRAQDRNGGSRPIRDVYGPGLTCIHHKLYLDVPECFVISLTVSGACPVAISSPPSMISTRCFLSRNMKQAEVSESSGLHQILS